MCPPGPVLINCLPATNQFLALLIIKAWPISCGLMYIPRLSSIRVSCKKAKNGLYELVVGGDRHGNFHIIR